MAAIINICVDPRLNQELIRLQVESRLDRLRLPAKRVFITSDIGGNIGSSFASTAQLLLANREMVAFAAVLHHDDCTADSQKKRQSLVSSVLAAKTALAALGIHCPVLMGTLRTEDNALTWPDEPERRYEVLNFRMPRL